MGQGQVKPVESKVEFFQYQRVKYVWNEDCHKSFDKPYLKVLQFSEHQALTKTFKLAVDASDVDAGSVLLQEDDNGRITAYSGGVSCCKSTTLTQTHQKKR